MVCANGSLQKAEMSTTNSRQESLIQSRTKIGFQEKLLGVLRLLGFVLDFRLEWEQIASNEVWVISSGSQLSCEQPDLLSVPVLIRARSRESEALTSDKPLEATGWMSRRHREVQVPIEILAVGLESELIVRNRKQEV